MDADVLLLARAQFGLNIGFHILFPSLTIALGWILLYFFSNNVLRPPTAGVCRGAELT